MKRRINSEMLHHNFTLCVSTGVYVGRILSSTYIYILLTLDSMYVCIHWLLVYIRTYVCKHKPEVGVFILDDVTVVDTVTTGGDVIDITTGQVTGLMM